MTTEVKMEVKLLSKDASVPQKANASDAGYDLCASKPCVVPAWGRQKVETDLAIAVPEGTYGRVAPRSGLAWKNGINVGAGVVDRGYRGPVGVVLFNLSDEDFVVSKGDRVAQLILERIVSNSTVRLVQEFADQTDRGAAGFGSSGLSNLTPNTTNG